MKLGRPGLGLALWTAWIAASVVLVLFARTLQRIERANALHRGGETSQAAAVYAELAGDLGGWRATLMPREHTIAVRNRLRLLYELEDYDLVIGEAEAYVREAGGVPPLVRFWLGNAYYRKAVIDDGSVEEDEAVAWLRRAGEQYALAVLEAPDDWDVKYNLELVQTLLRRIESRPEERIFDILRPELRNAPRPPARPVG